MNKIAIIGTGPAGIAAAQAVRSKDPAAKITLFGEEHHGYYSRPGLAYHLTGEIPEKSLFPYTAADFQDMKIRIFHAKAVSIDPLKHQLVLQPGGKMNYDRLLIATGAQAVRLNIPGANLEGVVSLDTLDDSRMIIKRAHKARTAVVVGGGITALEIVEGLVARKVKVHYLLRGDRYWNNVLDETESRLIEQRLQKHGVRIHYYTELQEIKDKRSRVAGVLSTDGRQIECDLVAVAIGVKPRTKLALAAGLKTDRGILVDEYLRTNIPDIYAAGDVAQVFDPLTGRSVIDSLWGPAREQGHTAGLNMVGAGISYVKQVPFNVTRLAGLTTTIIGTVGRGVDADLIGIARGDSETWRQLPDSIIAQSNFDVNRLRIMVGGKHLVGAIVMGDQQLSRPLHQLVSHRVDIQGIRDQLLGAQEKLADHVANFYTEWRSNHASEQS